VVDAELLRGGTAGRSASVLRVTVDRRDASLDLDAVAAVSAVVSEVLDGEDAAVPAGRYDLEVTSPGVERRLRRPAQFRSALGSEVAVKTRAGVPGERRLEGRLEQADEDGVVVAAAGGPRRLGYGEIEQAHTVFDWRAALAAGSRRQEGVARR
jgi:ribosome maturation factor RimP